MKLVCISDTHAMESKVKLPPGDVLLVAGDFTSKGRDWEINHFRAWLDKEAAGFRKVLVCAGNHDFKFERDPMVARMILNPNDRIIYLEDSGYEIDGIKFWGTPHSPMFCNWAFNLPEDRLAEKFAMIPDDANVLITHCPPYGVLDNVARLPSVMSVGSLALMDRIINLPALKLHVFGHIHEGYGVKRVGGLVCANVSVCDEHYRPVNAPFCFDLD